RSQGKGLIGRFIAWYAPFFNAYTFVLARNQEREADQAAVEACSSETAGRALVRTCILAQQADETYWEPLSRRPWRDPKPPTSHLSDLQRSLNHVDPAAERWLRECLARPSTHADTHP